MKIRAGKLSSPVSETDAAFVGNAIQYSYTDYGSIDHRVKLHIILNVFEHEKEELVLLLRVSNCNCSGNIVNLLLVNVIIRLTILLTFVGRNFSKRYGQDLSGMSYLIHFESLSVKNYRSRRVSFIIVAIYLCSYVLTCISLKYDEILPLNREDPQKWLHKECSWTMDRLRTISPLPFKQGILFEFYQPAKVGELPSNTTILCILQDFQRTSNFLSYLTGRNLLYDQKFVTLSSFSSINVQIFDQQICLYRVVAR